MKNLTACAGRVQIRLADAKQDAEKILAVYAPYVLHTAVTFEYDVPTLPEFTQRVAEIAASFPYLLLYVGDELAGYAYAHRQAERAAFGWNAELSIYFGERWAHHGLGKPLYALLMELLAAQGYVNFYGVITGSNVGSIAMHEHMGFVHCGLHERTGYKFGQWQDVVWMVRRMPVDVPREIMPLDALNPSRVQALMQQAAQAAQKGLEQAEQKKQK